MMRLAICFRGTTRAAAPHPYRVFIFNTRTLFSVGNPVPTGFAEDVHGRCCKGCQRPAGRGITRLEKGGNKSLLEKTPGAVSTCPRPAPGKTRTPEGGRTPGFLPSALFPYRESDGGEKRGAPFVLKKIDSFSGTDVSSTLVRLHIPCWDFDRSLTQKRVWRRGGQGRGEAFADQKNLSPGPKTSFSEKPWFSDDQNKATLWHFLPHVGLSPV